ncbi:MAG: M24 family metallopeptidase [Alphaproteobacteria bacterium]|nr:M24 family metallopeptidase [Alphaproteobacteria bacterium]
MTDPFDPTIDRRDFFAGIGAGAAGMLGATMLGGKEAHANWGLVAPGPVPDEDFDGRSLVNKARAYEIMEREDIDGIVALNPVNVFYLGNYFSYELQKLRAIPSFAVMPRDPSKPSFLVVSSSDLWFIANADREHPEIIPYGSPAGWENYSNPDLWNQEPEARSFMRMPENTEALTEIEQGWYELEKRWESGKAATPEWGLVHALKESGLINGKVAVDDMRIADILNTLGQDTVTCVPGDNTFRKIRMVKSDVEVGHMRRIARANQDACMAMLSQVEVGMTKADFDGIFITEAAKRGAKAMWIASGTIGGFRHGTVVEGQAMMVDAVSQINFYHGDFGRTWCVGEPPKELQERIRLTSIAREVAHDIVRPGMKYSQLQSTVTTAVKKASPSGWAMGVGPHTVGLQHTDQSYRDGLPFVVGDDLTFQENMTLTIDLPQVEIGWGATHLEDLIVVTKDGYEPLATMDDPLIIL